MANDDDAILDSYAGINPTHLLDDDSLLDHFANTAGQATLDATANTQPSPATAVAQNATTVQLGPTTTALANGVVDIPAIPDSLLRVGDRLGQYARNKLTGENNAYAVSPPLAAAEDAGLPTAEGQNALLSQATGTTPYTPTTPGGRIYQGAVSAVPMMIAGNVVGGADGLASALRAVPEAMGAGAGAATGNELYPGNPVAQIAGGALGGAGVASLGATGNALTDAATGGGITPERAALARQAEDQYGIPISGAMITNSPVAKTINYMADKIPLSGGGADQAAAAAGVTKALVKTMGGDDSITTMTPENMASIRDANSDRYDAVASSVPQVPVTPDHVSALQAIVDHAQGALDSTEVSPIAHQVSTILQKVQDNGGVLPSDTFLKLTNSKSSLGKAMNSPSSNIRDYAGQIKDVLYDALGQAAPDQAAALSQANTYWKNMRTVDGLAAKAGEDGVINPALLMNKVAQSYKGTNGVAYGGGGDIANIARISNAFLKPVRSSGTAENLQALGVIEGLGSAGQYLLHGDLPSAASLAMTAAGTVGAGRLATGVLNSNTYKNALLNSATDAAPTQNLLSPYVVPAGVALTYQPH